MKIERIQIPSYHYEHLTNRDQQGTELLTEDAVDLDPHNQEKQQRKPYRDAEPKHRLEDEVSIDNVAEVSPISPLNEKKSPHLSIIV